MTGETYTSFIQTRRAVNYYHKKKKGIISLASPGIAVKTISIVCKFILKTAAGMQIPGYLQ
jgi:hypothetical protein